MPLKDAAATLLESLSENLSGEAINRREETAKTSTGDLPENEETAEVPADNLPESVDEPATAVVMKRYADRIRELIPLASDEVAAQARALVKRCDELYDQANAFAEELSNIYEDDDIDVEGLQARMMAAQRVNEAIDDIQDAALSRELEFIKLAQRAGELSPEHARDLRNDVYVQRMVIN